MKEEKSLWIAMKKKSDKTGEILSAFCSCMTGTYECCNHIIATLYKMEYACRMGWCSPACTDIACQWNKSTKNDIEPKRISDIIVRKKLATNTGKETDDISREEKRMKELNEFDPRIELHRNNSATDLTNLLKSVQKANAKAVIFKSYETKSNQFIFEPSHVEMSAIVDRVLLQSEHSHTNLTQLLIQNMYLTEDQICKVEEETKGQADNALWYQLRLGRLTASKHHDIYTKVNSITKCKSNVRPKTTPLVAKMVYPKSSFKNEAMKWGIENETNAMKEFYANEAVNHSDFKTDKAGLFLAKQFPYIGASPDGIMYCKCHGKSTIEIKCPYKIKNQKIKEGSQVCDFLKLVDGNVNINTQHKYYTQIISQMAITNTKQAFFVVWTTEDIFIQIIPFDKKHWQMVSVNLEVFFKTYMCPALLGIKPITYCGSCDNVLLEESEIQPNEESELSSIQCDVCGCWFHVKCENVVTTEIDLNSEWMCAKCLLAIGII